MAPVPIWATTVMVQNETLYINIYMKLKTIFSNSNRYFAVLIEYTGVNTERKSTHQIVRKVPELIF